MKTVWHTVDTRDGVARIYDGAVFGKVGEAVEILELWMILELLNQRVKVDCIRHIGQLFLHTVETDVPLFETCVLVQLQRKSEVDDVSKGVREGMHALNAGDIVGQGFPLGNVISVQGFIIFKAQNEAHNFL